ncbi:uncharacterized protein LOC105792445 [Gossypium raimondii]|uniref:uncharacterized protein LOC105792445 n=1 Tax=Gossypium raimondii TaxID=29730 RepID=UPI00227A8D9F|nr:uncharacterized protein LOC105792445 [Gossypium raimondii]
MAATIAARSSFLRPVLRTATASRISFSVPNSSLRSTSTRPSTRLSPRLVRRELSTLQPVHSAVASACLVSKLPRDANNCAEGRFANYLIPI